MQKNIIIHVVDNYEELSKKAADIFATAVKHNPTGVYGFATGGTPEGMYSALVSMSAENKLDITKITAFNLDEYVSLRPSSPQSYCHFMAEKLFDKAGVPLASRNIPKGDAPCPHAESALYEDKISQSGGISLQILGIGTNGHIGFNEPSDIFQGQTSCVELAEDTIQANSRYFDNEKDVPRQAISMGIQTIMMAETILLLASGSSKAKILRDALTGPITPNVPASALQLHRNVIVIADKQAAELL